jgi:hypothetical protein
MPFVPHGKKAQRKRLQAAKLARLEGREQIIDQAIGALRLPYPDSRLCLQTCVLLERLLGQVLPPPRYSLRLGSLHVVPVAGPIGPIVFDPRGPDGIDGGFHAWLQDENGQILDPSILVTLDREGYSVNPMSYFLVNSPQTELSGLRFIYEAIPDLQLLGLAESEEHLARAMEFAMTGIGHPGLLGECRLDLAWRTKPGTSAV